VTARGEFPFPPLLSGGLPPRWDGARFVFADGTVNPVLAYHDRKSHWNDELTRLQEETEEGDHPIARASREMVFATFQRESLPMDGVCLDIGCSTGFLLRDFRRRLPSALVIGADFLRPPLERLAPDLPGVPLLQFDLRDCPLPAASVDFVTALNVLEHIDDDGRAMGQIARILRPGGVAHIEVPACPACYDYYDEVLMHYRRYRMRDLELLVERAGLHPLRRTHLGVFVLPAFFLIKRRNRRFASRSLDEKIAMVAQHLKRTHHSLLMRGSFAFELCIGRFCTYPMGIRCVIVARKE
jgi:SAM-dependent methyltransferase